MGMVSYVGVVSDAHGCGLCFCVGGGDEGSSGPAHSNGCSDAGQGDSSKSSSSTTVADDVTRNAAGPGEPGSAGGEGQGKEEGVAEEEESDLKLAWEILELARIICQR